MLLKNKKGRNLREMLEYKRKSDKLKKVPHPRWFKNLTKRISDEERELMKKDYYDDLVLILNNHEKQHYTLFEMVYYSFRDFLD